MKTRQTIEEKQRIFMDVLRQMKEHTFPSLSTICGSVTDDRGELVGSGTIVELRGKPYLLTAEHVAKQLFARNTNGERKYPGGLSHSVADAERMMTIAFPWYGMSGSKDIAATRLDPVVFDGTRVVALKPTAFARNPNNFNDDVYFVHGWPAGKSRFTSFFGRAVVSESQPYGGWLTDATTWSDFDPIVHVAITYPMKDTIDERGRPASVPMPGAMSGSLLWKTNSVGAGESWTANRATVVGLVHRWDQDAQCLIATRIEYVKGFLLLMLREEFAYFRWHNRGRPSRDDWADWLAAEREVAEL